ncbi:unnamed protein product, partial [Schistocephalus solidus]|uniref:SH3 domain-containing protein n=1 Tax=Schistocephalus solidus TaxID=70667 RepID=A0A183SJH2_SCHSO
ECRRQFQLALSEGSKQLSATYRKLKSSIEKSRPYSEVFYRRQQLILDIQRNSEQYGVAQAEFEAAQSVLDNYSLAAKFQDTDLSQLDDLNRAIDKVFHCCHIIPIPAHHQAQKESLPDCGPWVALIFGLEAKSYVDSLSERLKENKALYSQTLRQLEAISDRIHASRRSLGLEGEHCVNGLQGTFLSACLRGSGVGAEAKSDPLSEALRQRLSPFSSPLPPPCSSPNRQKRLLSSISSIPDSPRRTPPGQLDTDPEEEGSLTAGQTTFSDFLPILNGLRESNQGNLWDRGITPLPRRNYLHSAKFADRVLNHTSVVAVVEAIRLLCAIPVHRRLKSGRCFLMSSRSSQLPHRS